jgi:hypothetical protein
VERTKSGLVGCLIADSLCRTGHAVLLFIALTSMRMKSDA